MVNPNLDAGYPVILGLTAPEGGHAVLADGYGYNFSTQYYHINMGWSGSHDAWYNLPNINSNPSFNVIDECVYNIFTSGKGEIISGRVTDEFGNPVRGARVTATELYSSFVVETYSDETNDKGIYAISGLDSNTNFAVNVNKTGYNFGTKEVTTGKSSDYNSVSGNRWGINFADTEIFIIFEDAFSSENLDITKWAYRNGPVSVSQNSLRLGAYFEYEWDQDIWEPDDIWGPDDVWGPDIIVVPEILEPEIIIVEPEYPGGLIVEEDPFQIYEFGSVTSKVLDISQYSRATLTYRHKLNANSSESDLIVEYWNGSAWKEVSRLEGDQQGMANNYEKLTISLPSDAVHANFKLRIKRSWVNSFTLIGSYINYGDWFIDDVKITVTR